MKRYIFCTMLICLMVLLGCAKEDNNGCLFPRAEDSYVGDVMALETEEGVCLNYLYETDNNGPGYHPIHQFYTKDFVSYEDKGQILPFAEEMEAPDLAVGTGSFIIDDEGKYHCFYTGHNDYYEEYGLDKECLMHAVSSDNRNYSKDYESIIYAPEGYSTDDFRDPQVLKTDEDLKCKVKVRQRLYLKILKRMQNTGYPLITWKTKLTMMLTQMSRG